jgi:protein-disulfide isomerase
MNKINIEFQYFHGCPNSGELLKRVKELIEESVCPISLKKVLVESQEAAEKYKFRGSPTVLINGEDIEGLEENPTPSLACRYYQNGLPTKNDLEKFIKEHIL